MSDTPTPGQIAYETWWRSLNERAELDFAHQLPATKRAWEAAAQAVRSAYKAEMVAAWQDGVLVWQEETP
jgi:hypothetical protein